MDIQNFKNDSNIFPVSTDTLDRLQQQSLLLQQLTAIYGENYIIAQPDSSGENGIVVIAGELLPLSGSSSLSYITIKETSTSITFEGQTIENARIERSAVYSASSSGAAIATSGIKTIETIADMCSRLATEKTAMETALANAKVELQTHQVPKYTIAQVPYVPTVENGLPSGWMPLGTVQYGSALDASDAKTNFIATAGEDDNLTLDTGLDSNDGSTTIASYSLTINIGGQEVELNASDYTPTNGIYTIIKLI